MSQFTVAQALGLGRRQLTSSSESSDKDVHVLLAHVMGKDKAFLLTHPEVELNEAQQSSFESDLKRLKSSEPLPYIIGEWEFYGLKFKITPDVLIPRPETEMLVETGLRWLQDNPGRRRALDVGTGSGCIPVALAINAPDLQVIASEISTAALEVAQANVDHYQLSARIQLIEADLLTGIDGNFDLITANLPYIPDERLPGLEVSKWEPRVALVGGPDGLRFIGPYLRQAQAKLNVAGLVLAEIDASLDQAVIRLAQSLWPDAMIEVRQDLAGLPRLLVVETK